MTARQRAPRDDANALVGAQGQHLTFLFTVQQVVVVLHADETRPAIGVGHMLGGGELPCPHRRGTEVANFASTDDIVQRLHRLGDRCAMVPSVDLVQVDVIGTESPQAVIDRRHDGHPRQPLPIGAGPHTSTHFCGNHHLIARHPKFGERPPQVLLTRPQRVHVRGVEEVDTCVESLREERPRCLLIERPRMGALRRFAITHASETDT